MRLFFTAAVAAVALLGVGCNSSSVNKGVALDPMFKEFVTADYDMLAGLNVQRLQQSEIYKRHASEFDTLYDSLSGFGLDLRHNVYQVVLASNGERTLLFSRGKFDAKKLQQPVQGTEVETEKYRSYQLFGAEHYRVALVKNEVLLGGTPDVVHAAIDTKEDARGEIPDALRDRLDTISQNAQLWVASREGLPFAKAPMRSDVRSAMSNIIGYISGTTAGAEFTSGVRLNAKLNCISEEGVTRVHDALRGAIGLARLSTKDDQTDLLKLYDAIEVKKASSAVEIKADLTSEQAERLLALLPQFKNRAGQLAR